MIEGLSTTQIPVNSMGKSQLDHQSATVGKTDFSTFLEESLDKVNEAQLLSDKKTEALAMGETQHLHDVMVTAKKASILLETTVQVQKKAVDAYQEIMRMQV